MIDTNETKTLLILIDGHALVHRSFHAIQQPLTISTTGEDVRAWYLAGTPFDFMGGSLGNVTCHGLISFTFNLIIPPASIVWEKTVERAESDFGDLLYSTPYKYTMRHRFMTPYYPGA